MATEPTAIKFCLAADNPGSAPLVDAGDINAARAVLAGAGQDDAQMATLRQLASCLPEAGDVLGLSSAALLEQLAAAAAGGQLRQTADAAPPQLYPLSGKPKAPPVIPVKPNKKPKPGPDPNKEIKDEIRLVELVEVVTHKGVKTNRACAARKQYINLDDTVDSATAHPEFGRVLRFKARIEWVSGDQSKSLSGTKVFWYITPDGGNKAGLTGNEREGWGGTNGTLKTSSGCDAKGWTPEIALHTSVYGGDSFSIGATLAANHTGGLTGGPYTVWRKLWFEIDTMKRRSGTGVLEMDHAAFPPVYVPCFIELEKQGTDNEPANVWNLTTPKLGGFAKDYFGAARSPFQAHEIGIDHQADKADGNLAQTLTAPVFVNGAADSYYVYDGGDTWLKTAQYQDGTVWKNLPKAQVTLAGASVVYKNITIDMSTGPLVPSLATPVNVRLTFTRSREWSGDGANPPHAVIAMGFWYDTETATDAKKRTVGTMVHELGHLLKMVPLAQSTHVDTGTGQHCSDAVCVMFGTNTPIRLNKFCAVCTETLRRADLSTVKAAFKKSKGAKS